MPATRVIDYYKTLAVPADADLVGIENAYVRLSGELVEAAPHDETASRALNLLNEAYGVLANAEQRQEYDRVLFADEYAALEQRLQAELRRRSIIRSVLIGGLCFVVLGQAAILAYIGGDVTAEIAQTVLGPLYPGGAG